jgi:hypothetical protein
MGSMSDSERDPADEEILGRLPRIRPGRRSPRRDEAARLRAKAAEQARADSARARASAGEERERAAPSGPTPQPGVGDAIAGVARAGVAVASGSAKLGLKAAGGALGAIRGTIDRR